MFILIIALYKNSYIKSLQNFREKYVLTVYFERKDILRSANEKCLGRQVYDGDQKYRLQNFMVGIKVGIGECGPETRGLWDVC